jgi:GNAT superfamily N-acetyltransferase
MNHVIRYYSRYLGSWNRLIFHEYGLEDVQKKQLGGDVEFFRITRQDMDRLDQMLEDMDIPSEFTIEDALQRIQRGYRCYCVSDRDRIVGYLWFAVKRYWIPYCNATLHVRDHECYSFNVYVLKQYRGRNLFNRLKQFAFVDLKGDGFTRSIGSYFHWNAASRRANEKLGSSAIGAVDFGYAAGIPWRIVRTDGLELEFHDRWFSVFSHIVKRARNRRLPPVGAEASPRGGRR